MSIQSEVARLQGAKQTMSTFLTDNGVAVASTDKIDTLAEKLPQANAGYLPLTGGTLTGNLAGQYISATWLQTTATSNLNAKPGRIPVLDGSGWLYYRTPAEILADIGAAPKVGVLTATVE